jgi:excisionase family DNA binding protein
MRESTNVTDFLRYEQAAEEFNIPVNTLYTKVSRREIPHFRLGGRCIRFSRAELNKFFEAHRVALSEEPQSK